VNVNHSTPHNRETGFVERVADRDVLKVIGSYRLLEKLGEGAMGTVWVAEHLLLGRRAAIKLLQPTYSTSKSITQRFFNEAKVIAAIANPGIVQIFDFGLHGDGSPYIVMEMLDGEGLDARLRRAGRLGPRDAVRLVKQVAISLSTAHGKGVIHRDLKPENLFIARDPAVPGGERVKVLDFGIAKLSRGDGRNKTRTGVVLGTPAYMSPEQCRGVGTIDHRADIYSLGAVLFCLVTGRPPFRGEGAGDVIIAQVRDRPPVPSALAPGIPAALDAVILRCLEKDPSRRYQAMGELTAALDGLEASSRGRAAPAEVEHRHATHHATEETTLLFHETTTISQAHGEVTLGTRSARRWLSFALCSAPAIAVAVAIASYGADRTGAGTTSAAPGLTGSGAPAGTVDAPAELAPQQPPGGTVAGLSVTPMEPTSPDASIDAVRVRESIDVPSASPPGPVQRKHDNRRDTGGVKHNGTEPKTRKVSSNNVGFGD
jgi:serine/threonine protein kinase